MDIGVKDIVVVSECTDVDAIKDVFTHPEIWATIAEDNQYPEDFEVDLTKELYMACLVNGEIIGFYAFAVVNGIELDIHAQILPKFRKKYSLASGKAILDWFFHYAPEKYQKLTAQIPFKYPNVKDFALRIGFQHEGVNRKSYKKDGVIYDQWHLGITRDEIGTIYELG